MSLGKEERGVSEINSADLTVTFDTYSSERIDDVQQGIFISWCLFPFSNICLCVIERDRQRGREIERERERELQYPLCLREPKLVPDLLLRHGQQFKMNSISKFILISNICTGW